MEILTQAQETAKKIVDRIGPDINLAIPLGAGKPNHLVNALYELARETPSINLTILTALTLNKPQGKSFLEKKFLGPFADRVFGDYPNLTYEEDLVSGKLPSNVKVVEFYFPAGKRSHLRVAQENYTSSNYTHVARDLLDLGVNVLAHLVASDEEGTHLSLSCNADVTTDIVDALKKQGKSYVLAAQVNNNLPFMYGDGVLAREEFDFILENQELHYPIFAPPKMSVPDTDHMVGLYASTLIKDGGELQVGIGSFLGDALVYSLLERQKNNSQYLKTLETFDIPNRYSRLIEKKGDLKPFEKGLFGATEMFVDSFMYLIKANILKRKVYDSLPLQRLINEGLISERVTKETLYHLLERRAVQPVLREKDFYYLQQYGVFKESLSFQDGYLQVPNGPRIEGNLNKDENFQQVIEYCLGEELTNGAIIHGGFFLGCNEFYNWLRDMPKEQRRLIHMKPVSKINQLYGHEDLDRLHRTNARFVNTCLIHTLSGAAASDGLENGQVVSGVGGQYNFVAMAHALPDGHSVIQLRSTRQDSKGLHSSIVFNYGHITIPRHLRDIVITEYGIADIRGKSDSVVAKALIEISDSRFQQDLVDLAKGAGKLEQSYEIPQGARQNTPEHLARLMGPLKSQGIFPKFPFGTELTDVEIQVGGALKKLKKKLGNKKAMAALLAQAATQFSVPKELEPALERMDLLEPKGLQQKLYQKLLICELR